MQISSSFIADVPNLHPWYFQGQPTPRQLLPAPPSSMLNDSIYSLLLSNSLLSDISTLALLFISFRESQYIAHTALCISVFPLFYHLEMFHSYFFPILFPRYQPHPFHRSLVFPPSLQCVSTPYLQAKWAGPSSSLTPSSLSPSPRCLVLWSVTAPGIFWMICCKSVLVDRTTSRGMRGSSSLVKPFPLLRVITYCSISH